MFGWPKPSYFWIQVDHLFCKIITSFIFFSRMKREVQLPEEVFNLIPDASLSLDKEALQGQLIEIITQRLDSRESLVILYILDGLTLAEIAPDLVHPVSGKAVKELLEYVSGVQGVFKWEID